MKAVLFGNEVVSLFCCFTNFRDCKLNSFLGERVHTQVSNIAAYRVGLMTKPFKSKESRVGKKPIDLPSNANFTMEGQNVMVRGPLGELSLTLPQEVKLEQQESGQLRMHRALETRRAHQMHGLFRTLTDNMLIGVTKGFEKRLLLVGVGYRAVLEGNDIVLSLGFSHPVRIEVPDKLQVKVEESTKITVSGYDKCFVGDFAASIRRWRPPEPYKGKGVRYADEVVRRKEGKAGKKK